MGKLRSIALVSVVLAFVVAQVTVAVLAWHKSRQHGVRESNGVVITYHSTLNTHITSVYVQRCQSHAAATGCTRIRIKRDGTWILLNNRTGREPHLNVLNNFDTLMKKMNQSSVFTGFDHDFDMDISTGDTPTCPKVTCSGGLIGISRNPFCPTSVVLPIGNNQANLQRDVLTVKDPHTWDEKKSKAVWHGSRTGHIAYSRLYSPGDYLNQTPRRRVVNLGKRFPVLLDASFERVPWDNLIQYKFIVAVSGNSWASILKPALASGSCVISQDSVATEWFEPLLEPWVHYVPVRHDLSDLIEKIEWAIGNNQKSREIAENGRRFALKHFSELSVINFSYNALKPYVDCGTA